MSSRCSTVKLLLWWQACANAVGALQVLITPNLADQVPRQQFLFDFELERSLVAADQRREADDGAERSDAGASSLVSTPDCPVLCAYCWRRCSAHDGACCVVGEGNVGVYLHEVDCPGRRQWRTHGRQRWRRRSSAGSRARRLPWRWWCWAALPRRTR